MNLLHKISKVWQGISLVQRALLTAVLLTLVAAGGLFTYWAQRPDMQLLYSNLSPEEASKITDKVNEKGIAYELRGGGTSVYVPRQHVYQLRLDMARDGLPMGDQGGYEIFDNEKIGISPFVQNVNLKRALQDELAKSIQMMDGIMHARVHIVSPEQKMFATTDKTSTASVALKLKPGYQLSHSNIAAITHLVSSSVENLKSENVTIVDSTGRLLSSKNANGLAASVDSNLDYKEKVELNLSQKVEDMLTAVLGPGKASVRVNAEIDMTSLSTVTESYDPTKKVVTKEEAVTKKEVQPGRPTADGEGSVAGGSKTDETITNEYKVGKIIEQKTELPGEITSITVAAFVDLTVEPVATEAGQEPATTTATTEKAMEVSDVEAIIQNALGLKSTDAIKVVETRFHKQPVVMEEPAGPDMSLYIEIARHASLGIMAVCVLLVLKIFGGSKKKASTEAPTEALAVRSSELGMAAANQSADPQVLRRQIAAALQENPDQVKNLFINWIEEKG